MMYQPYYCEENIWHLCQSPKLQSLSCSVLFISNPAGTCALWNQKASTDPQTPIVWDYHVVAMSADPENANERQIWDLDTTLGLPTPLEHYLRKTFGLDLFHSNIPEKLRPLFRVIPAKTYVTHLCTDRSHMRDADGSWAQPPPPWPVIGQKGFSNLANFRDMQTPFHGSVLTLLQLAQRRL